MTDRDLSFSVTLHCKAKVTEDDEGYTVQVNDVQMGTLGTLSGSQVDDEVRLEMGARARVLALKYALDKVSGGHESTQWTPDVGAKA